VRNRKLARGYSDFQTGNNHRGGKLAKASPGAQKFSTNGSIQARDNSLDYYLEPEELRRLQMSPTMRNSVEFIRKNSTESGRVIRVYKNGCPYDKPLRVCILRGEFASLNHLLDHINGRTLVPCGARYLFHLDGQMVYSVHELKHGSVYVVSGTRNYDHLASGVLRDQSEKERRLQQSRSFSDLSNISLRRRQENTDKLVSHCSSEKLDNNKGQMLSQTKSSKSIQSGERINHHEKSSEESDLRQRGASEKDTSAEYQSKSDHPISNGAEKRPNNLGSLKSRELPVAMTRAKSELSAIPDRPKGGRKKMVTFVDTGRGSSPALDELTSNELRGAVSNIELIGGGDSVEDAQTSALTGEDQENVDETQATNEIGIQVNGSLEGFLIDLPMELPARGDDSNLKKFRRTNSSNRRPIGGTSREKHVRSRGAPDEARDKGEPEPNLRGQIVTITERQLSLDEMSQLMDLDQGDHHGKAVPQITIKLEPVGDATESDENEQIGGQSEVQKIQATDEGGNGDEEPIVVGDSISKDSFTEPESARDASQNYPSDEADSWQYPAGRGSISTPTERSVSQSDARELAVNEQLVSQSPLAETSDIEPPRSFGSDHSNHKTMEGSVSLKGTPARSRRSKREVPVRGELCKGLYEPAKNFKLLWVNGFTINDQYPANSFSIQQQMAIEREQQRQKQQQPVQINTRAPSPSGKTGTGRQSPSYESLVQASNEHIWSGIQFKPSERFQNWICHSRLHHELIYPCGTLIVLWCRWTNGQRFYSKHTTNVSTVCISTGNTDLAASAQVSDKIFASVSATRQTASKTKLSNTTGAQIHLWSITNLETLYVIDDDQLRTKRIFSMRLRNSSSRGCELNVCARDDKQLTLATFRGDYLSTDGMTGRGEGENEDLRQGKMDPNKANNIILISNSKLPLLTCTLRGGKTLQQNQLPLALLLAIPIDSKIARKATDSKQEKPIQDDTAVSPLISIGRRHFQLWAPEKRAQKLRSIQPENKSSKFVEIMGRVTCLARLSPDEFLLGDSEGNVSILIVNYRCSPSQRQTASTGSRRVGESDSSECSLDTIDLLDLKRKSSELKLNIEDGEETDRTGPPRGITCLARISGTIFACADTTCTLSFYKIRRETGQVTSTIDDKMDAKQPWGQRSKRVSCQLIKSLSLPPDLGFICSIIVADYDRRNSMGHIYVVSTSNTILLGSIKLSSYQNGQSADNQDGETSGRAQMESLSVVYEGHETAASSLVADVRLVGGEGVDDFKYQHGNHYFTCSVDCRICKWNGKQLLWKSLLPSSCASLAVHPIGFVLAVGSIDGTVYILDKISGLLISYFPLTPVCINCLAYSRDGALLAAGCANGSIFILPVYERGLKYKKVSIFQSPHPVVSLQFSTNGRYILTSVTHSSWQELILWDLPNFRYMRDNVKFEADKIDWFDSICSGSEDVRAIWENANLLNSNDDATKQNTSRNAKNASSPVKKLVKNPVAISDNSRHQLGGFVVNLSCHRLVKSGRENANSQSSVDYQGLEPSKEDFVIASDTRGYLRLFRYPCYDIQQGFYATRVSSLPVSCCRFLHSNQADYFVSTSVDGTICWWALE